MSNNNIFSQHQAQSTLQPIAPPRSPVGVQHEVAVGEVGLWRLALVLVVEELWQGALLDAVDGVVVEPGRVAGNDDVVRLLGSVILHLVLAVDDPDSVKQQFISSLTSYNGTSRLPGQTRLLSSAARIQYDD